MRVGQGCLHPLGSTCSQRRGESCPTTPLYPQGLFVPAGTAWGCQSLPWWHSQSWSSDRLVNRHLATGHLLNPTQPCSGQGQPSHPLGPDTARCLPSAMPNVTTFTVPSTHVLALSHYPKGQSRHFSVSTFCAYVASMHPLGMLHIHAT